MKLFIPLLRFMALKMPLLADYYRYRRDSKPLMRSVKYREALGFSFNGPDSMEKGLFEPDETEIFETVIGHFDVLVNIGANTGYYALKALSRNVDVLAFEPNYLNTKILLRNIINNDYDATFHLIPIALGDTVSLLPMYGVSTGASLVNGWAGQTHSTTVPVNTFDNVASKITENKKCFVLIDIEGAELNCLKGSQTLLADVKRNVFFVEITVKEHQPKGVLINPNLKETFSLFFKHKYRAYTADKFLREVVSDEIDQINASGVDTLGVHNFLFIASERGLSEIGLE